MIWKIIIAAPIIFILTACGPVHKTVRLNSDSFNTIENLAVVVPNAPDFAVQYKSLAELNEALPTAANIGILMTGAVVGAVHTEMFLERQRKKDSETAKLIGQNFNVLSFMSIFRDSLYNTLKGSGRFVDLQLYDDPLDIEKSFKYNAVQTIRIGSWGLRLVDRDMNLISPFIEFSINIKQIQNKITLMDEHKILVGKERESIQYYQENKELLNTSLKQLFKTAGYSMANLIIYP